MPKLLASIFGSILVLSTALGCGGSSSSNQNGEFDILLPDTFFGFYNFELTLVEQEANCTEVVELQELQETVQLEGLVSDVGSGSVVFESNLGIWEGQTLPENEEIDFSATLLLSQLGCIRFDSMDVSVTTTSPGVATMNRVYDCFSAFCSQTFTGEIAQFTPDE